MEKLYSLPNSMTLGLDAVRFNLQQALNREDIPRDLKSNIAKLCEALGDFIQHAMEAQEELDLTGVNTQ